MIIICLKTDEPEALVELYEDTTLLAKMTWQAHRQLAETIHKKIEDLLAKQQIKLKDVAGFVCYKGPGSFTGLRIGLSTGNALAYGLGVSVVAQNGNDWQQKGIERLMLGQNEETSMPEYGGKINITLPRK